MNISVRKLGAAKNGELIMNQNFLMLTISTSILGCSLFLFAGCGAGKDSRIPQRYTISGIVTLDGKPLESGSIRFSSPADAKLGISSGGNVVDGRYELMATEGTKSVQISCMKETSKNVFKNLVPPKYNLKSSLEAEVGEDTKEVDFELTSK